jgi:hypothetical protein
MWLKWANRLGANRKHDYNKSAIIINSDLPGISQEITREQPQQRKTSCPINDKANVMKWQKRIIVSYDLLPQDS